MRTINNFDLKSTIPKEKLLDKLRDNRDKHAAIVKEAQEGYIDKAQQAIKKKLAELKRKNIVSLHFSLYPPKDHTEAYTTVIKMLEMSTDEHIVLTASEFRQLVEDEWEWTDDFLTSNSNYSVSAMTEARSKGL
tara:strand:- start:1190 stop:1591 length:402 start_codon:yes stop_codon:yes gene_type:complete